MGIIGQVVKEIVVTWIGRFDLAGYERPNDGIDQDCFAGDLKVKASVREYGGVCILDQKNLGYCWRPGYSSFVLISDQHLLIYKCKVTRPPDTLIKKVHFTMMEQHIQI